jgi:WD40 repeat protein
VIDFAFSPDGRSLAITRDNRIETWDVASGQKIIDLEGEIEGGIWEVVYGQGGYVAAFGQKYRGAGENIPELKVWRASNGRLLYFDDRMLYWTNALDISADGKLIAYLDREGIGIHDIRTGEILQSAPGDYDAAFSTDGTRLFTSGYREYGDRGFPIWMYTRENGEKTQILAGTKCQNLSRNGSALIGYGLDEIIIIDPATGLALKTISMPTEIENAAISPDGRYLAVIEGYKVVVVETNTENVLKIFDFDYFATLAVGLVRLDGTDYYAAALGNNFGMVRVLDLATGLVLLEFKASESMVWDTAFSPDRLTLASIDKNYIARLWNLQDESITQEYDLSAQGADGKLSFSPDGLKLAIRDWNQPNTFELDLQSGELRQIEKSAQAFRISYSLTYF